MSDSHAMGRCQCGQAEFSIAARPLFRAICHCSVCQQFNRADCADVSVCPARAVAGPATESVDYRTWKWPPLLQRGRCRECDTPAIEWLGPWPRFAIVPSANHTAAEMLPPPSFHIFYDCRVTDAADDLPRYAGYLASQWAFVRHLLTAGTG